MSLSKVEAKPQILSLEREKPKMELVFNIDEVGDTRFNKAT